MSLNYSTTLEEIKTLIYNGYYNKALDKINGTLEELTTNNKMIFQFLILKNKILIRQGNFNDCLTILDKILQDKKLELELTVRIDFLL